MKILVASDGSKASLNAVKYAVKLCADLRSTSSITLVSVHDDTALRHASQFVGREQVEDHLHDMSEKELKSARKVLETSGIKHNQVILIGRVSEEIVKLGSSGKYGLIVMGAKGRSGLADLLLGSIAQRVVATAKQPVLLVK